MKAKLNNVWSLRSAKNYSDKKNSNIKFTKIIWLVEKLLV